MKAKRKGYLGAKLLWHVLEYFVFKEITTFKEGLTIMI